MDVESDELFDDGRLQCWQVSVAAEEIPTLPVLIGYLTPSFLHPLLQSRLEPAIQNVVPTLCF